MAILLCMCMTSATLAAQLLRPVALVRPVHVRAAVPTDTGTRRTWSARPIVLGTVIGAALGALSGVVLVRGACEQTVPPNCREVPAAWKGAAVGGALGTLVGAMIAWPGPNRD